MRANARDQWFFQAGKLGLSISEAERLLSLGRKLHRLAELRCNGSPIRAHCRCPGPGCLHRDHAEADEAGYERDFKRTVQRIDEAVWLSAAPMDVQVKTSGDPRGPVLRLVLADGREVCVA